MKKSIFIFLIFVLILNCSICFAVTVDNYDVIAQINSDGSVDVTENITYNFDEFINGQFINITYNNNKDSNYTASGISNLSVFVDHVIFKKVDYASKGENGIYTIEDNGTLLNLKVFMPSQNEKKIMQLNYTLDNAVVKYDDVAEFYWNFITDDWEYEVQNVTIKILLPESTTPETIQVWGYNSLSNLTKTVDSQTVTLSIPSVKNSCLATGISFPTKQINSTYSKYIPKNNLEDTLSNKTDLTDETELQKEGSKLYLFLLNFILSFIK